MDGSAPSPDTDRENNRLAAIVESSDDAIIGKDLSGVITSWNAGAARMFGYTAAEIVGQPVTRLIPPERLDEETQILTRIRAGERVHHYETVRRRKDGSYFEVSLTVSPVRNSAGHIVGASKIARDITEQKRTTRALQLSEQRFRLLASHAPVGIFLTDEAGNCVFVNQRWCEFSGLNVSEAQGEGWSAALHPADRARVLAEWRQALAQGRSSVAEYRFRRPDGSVVWIEGQAVKYSNDDGFQGYLGTCSDITLRKRSEMQVAFLHQLGDRLALQTDPGHIREEAQQMLAEHLEADRCCFLEVNPQQDAVVIDRDWHQPELASLAGRYRLADLASDELRERLELPRQQIDIVTELMLPSPLAAALARLEIGAVASTAYRRGGQWIFSLAVATRHPRSWLPQELELMEHVAARIWPTIEQARATEALQLSEKHHREVLMGLPIACYTLDADNRINFFNEAAAELWGRRPALHEELWCGSAAMARLDGTPLPLDRCPAALAAGLDQPVRGEEAYVIRPDGTRRWVAPYPTPLFDGEGRRTGLINVILDVTDQREGQKAERQRAQTLEILHRTSNALVAEHELEKIVQAVTDAGRETSGAAFGAFFYNSRNDQGEIYTLYTLSGVPREAFANFPMPRATALFGPTFRGEGVVRVADVLQDPRYGQNAPRHGMPPGHLPVRSYLAVPVVSRSGEVLGGLFFGHPEPGVFTREAETVMVALAAQAAIAIDNARLYSELQKELVERRRKEELLVESEGRWRQLAEAMPHLVWSCQPDGTCDYLSRQWVAYTGVPEIDQLGDGWLEFVHPDDREALAKTWRATVESGGALDTEFRIRRADGQYRWFKTRAVPIRDQGGRITKWYGSNTDIEDVRRAEQAVRQSEQELRLVTDHAPIFLAHCDRHHRFKYINPAYAQRFNRTREEIVGRHIAEVVGPEAYATFRRHMDTTLAGQRTEFEQEIPYAALGRRWVHVIYEPELNEQGEVAGLVAVVTDITARKQAELELERARDEALAASRAKDDFFATLSHELRTPLSPVLLAASDAARNPALSAETRDSFEMIHRNVSLEARLIDDLLDLTRITRGKLLLEKQPLDLHTVLRHALANSEADFAGKHIRLELHLDAPAATVLGDPVRLQQVMGNILANAVKFTPEHGHVRVRTARAPDDRHIAVEIADDGIGLLPSELDGIFKPFIQGGQGRNGGPHRFGGLGLGLAISRQLVELHAGRIHAHSAGKNQGATFVVELPLTAPTEATPLPAARAAEAPAAAGTPPARRVLLVEDHATTRKTIQKLLSRRNYDVTGAESAAAARDLASSQAFDFLVSDVGLPDGDGYQLFVELRSIQPHLLGIALSGYGMEEDMQRSRAAGFQAHLIKPVSIEALENALARLAPPAPPSSPNPPPAPSHLA